MHTPTGLRVVLTRKTGVVRDASRFAVHLETRAEMKGGVKLY